MGPPRADASSQVLFSIIELGEALIDPVATVMTSPNATPHKSARDGSTRDPNRPDMPKFSARRLAAVPVTNGLGRLDVHRS